MTGGVVFSSLMGLGHSWLHYSQQLSPYPQSAVTEANGPPILVYTRATGRTESIDGSAHYIYAVPSGSMVYTVGVQYVQCSAFVPLRCHHCYLENHCHNLIQSDIFHVENILDIHSIWCQHSLSLDKSIEPSQFQLSQFTETFVFTILNVDNSLYSMLYLFPL